MAYMPQAIPSGTTVEAVLNLAQNVAHDFGSAPAIFSSGERAAIELASELGSYQQLASALIHPVSPLTANLIPCRDALENMASIRRKYPHGRNAKLRLSDTLQWNTKDKREFEGQVAKLREDTGRLRELVRELQRSAIESLRNHHQQQQQQQQQQQARGRAPDVNFNGAHMVQTTVSVASSSTASFTPRNTPYAPNNTKSKATLPMCPNGPGCRTPSCGFNFNHPRAASCEDGKNCSKLGCQLFHPKAAFCDKGPSCSMVGCEKAHPWPRDASRQATASVYSYASADRSIGSPNPSVSDMSTFTGLRSQPSMSQISSVQGSQSSQPSERDSSRGFSQQQFQPKSWTGPGGSQAAPMSQPTTGPSTHNAAQAQSTGVIQETPRGPANRNKYNQQEWCKLRYDCPGGYNGQCPLKHPRRTLCWDFQGGNCPRGASCTFYHGPVEVSQVNTQYVAELSGISASQAVAELPGNYVAVLPERRY
ncbi:hypothetical protein V8F33_014013 [Rhypophila sp. PSN 637]